MLAGVNSPLTPAAHPNIILILADDVGYGDAVEELNCSVAEIVHVVKAAGIDDRTLILFTSDNGPFPSYGNRAGPSRGWVGQTRPTTPNG